VGDLAWYAAMFPEVVCHRLTSRMLTGGSLFCARCTGLYLGLLAVSVGLFFVQRPARRLLPRGRFLLLALLGLLPLALDTSFFERSWPGLTPLRWASGLLAGGSLALLLLPLVNGLRPSAWALPIVGSWRELAKVGSLLGLLFVLGLLPLPVLQRELSLTAFSGLLFLYLATNAVIAGSLLSFPTLEDPSITDERPPSGPAPPEAAGPPSPAAPARVRTFSWHHWLRGLLLLLTAVLLTLLEFLLLGWLAWS